MLYYRHDLQKAGFIFINKTSVVLHSYASRCIYFMFMPPMTINRWLNRSTVCSTTHETPTQMHLKWNQKPKGS